MDKNTNNNNNRDSVIDYLAEIPNFLSMFMFAVFFLAASPMLIDMSISTGIDAAELSLIFTFYTVGAVSGQLTSVLYNRKFKKLQVIAFSYILIILFTILLTFSRNLYLFYFLYMVNGYLLGVIWIQANKYILENKVKNKDRITTIALSFYPVGAFTAPFIASNVVRIGMSWKVTYYVITFIIVLILILYFTILKNREGKKIVEEEKVGFKEIFVNKNSNIIFVISAFLIVFYCISETVISTWSPTFFRTERMFDVQSAGFAVSIFWASVIAGRVIIGILAGKVKSIHIMFILSIIAIISVILMIILKTKITILVIMIFVGIGFSGLFPLLISTGSTVYKKGRGILATILFASSNIGISIAPVLTRFASSYNMIISVALSVFFMFFMIILLVFLLLSEKKVLTDSIEVITDS